MIPLRDPTRYQNLLSGRHRGPGAVLLRALLGAAEIPYRWAVQYRNWRYDHARHTVHRVGVPVVSVGNITTGGTGKTPLVAWLARWFVERGVRVVLVSRGYGAKAARPGADEVTNDEARELARRLPTVPHLQHPDRVAVARRAVAEHQAQLILLDDGFQHRRIHRDLDIVLIDALQPFGYGHVLPRGLLREPLAALRRAQLIALSRADTVDPPRRRALRDEVLAIAPQAAWLEVEHRPRRLVNAAGESRPLEDLRGRRVAAFAGVGNPAGFYHTLQQLGCQLQTRLAFPDHCRFDARDLDLLRHWLREQEAVDAVVCTGKDLVKFEVTQLNDRPLWALEIDVHVAQGCELLEARLLDMLQSIGK